MSKKIEFTQEKKAQMLAYHKDGMSCKEIGKIFNVGPKPITRILKNEFKCKMYKERPVVGDIVKGWLITEIYSQRFANQSVTMAKIVTTRPGDDSTRDVPLTCLTNGQIGSCFNYRNDNILRNTTHGKSKTRIYRIWSGMKNRCSGHKRYKNTNYAKLKIKICDDWNNFENFEKWAVENGYEDNLSLDRVDPKGDYCPENCRWSTWNEQCLNKTNSPNVNVTMYGKTKPIQEWARDSRCVVTYNAFKARIAAGWEPERALTQPAERERKMTLEAWVKLKHPEIYNKYCYEYDLDKDGV